MDISHYNRRATQLLEQYRYADLRNWSAEMLAAHPDYANALLHQGISRIEGGDESGFEWMEQALARDPENEHYHYVLALANVRKHRFEASLRFIDSALALAPRSSRYHTLKGATLNCDFRCREALPVLEEALRLNPEDSNALIDKAFALVHLKQPETVHELVKKALELQPEKAHVHLIAGVIYYDLREYRSSITILEEHFRLDPGGRHARYTHLMAHHSRLSSLVFRPQAAKPMRILTLVFSCLALLAQLAVLLLPGIPPVIPQLLLYIAYTCVLYVLARGSLVLWLVLRLEPRFRTIMEDPKKGQIRIIRAALLFIGAIFLADCILHQPLSHLGFVVVLNALLLTFAVRNRSLLLHREKYALLGYIGVLMGTACIAFQWGMVPASGLLAAASGIGSVMLLPFLLQAAKQLLGFTQRRERMIIY